MSPIEIVASVSGLLSVILTVRRSIWCWPTGLLMVALYIVIFYEAKLYADMGLQVVYVVLQIYGWWHWARGTEAAELPVTGLGAGARVAWAGAGLLGTALIGWFTANHTDAALPYPDAFITAVSLVAQWLMARKVWESWLGWIVVDLVAVPVYYTKELYLTSGLYLVFLGLAISGLVGWRRALERP